MSCVDLSTFYDMDKHIEMYILYTHFLTHFEVGHTHFGLLGLATQPLGPRQGDWPKSTNFNRDRLNYFHKFYF